MSLPVEFTKAWEMSAHGFEREGRVACLFARWLWRQHQRMRGVGHNRRLEGGGGEGLGREIRAVARLCGEERGGTSKQDARPGRSQCRCVVMG